ncbi:MAG: hypothetical protein GXO79_15155 [Chlorobi bacterium]|nr:hypothetical protein [Chlorobiota bacterium]
MRNFRKIAFWGMSILITTLISCTKDDQNIDGQNDKSSDISGTYTGTLTTENTETVTNATLVATKIDSQTVKIHCYGEELDTTFSMLMYSNGDSIMLCYTDSMFNMEYGHHLSDEHHGMGNGGMNNDEMIDENGMIDWAHHLDEEHDSIDMHYGGFNIANHTIDYTMNIEMTNNTRIYKRFQGTKQ